MTQCLAAAMTFRLLKLPLPVLHSTFHFALPLRFSLPLFLDWKHDNSNIYLIAAQRDPLSLRPTGEYTYLLD